MKQQKEFHGTNQTLKSKDELYSDSGRWRWVPDSGYAWILGRDIERTQMIQQNVKQMQEELLRSLLRFLIGL